MHSFIPHKDNPHIFRKFFGGAVILCASFGIAYFIQNYSQKLQIKAQAEQVGDEFIVQESEVEQASEINQAAIAETLKDEKNNEALKADIIPESVIPPPPAEGRNKNPNTKLGEAMIYTKPQILTGKYIDISLGYQNMVIFEDGKALDAFLISSGRKGFNTPIGTFKIENKYPRAWSKKYALWMPYWMAFKPAGEMGIHELPEWPGGHKEGANHLGTAVSHGCVRLGVGPAKQVYDWAEIGTPVIIHK